LFAAFLILPNTASAGWSCVQGTNAHLQDDSLAADPAVYFGWGFDCIQKSGIYNWIQVPIPMDFGVKTRGIVFSVMDRKR
jgi:hypothetical protein